MTTTDLRKQYIDNYVNQVSTTGRGIFAELPGDITVYKKVLTKNGDGAIATLVIPKETVCYFSASKCRATRAFVKKIERLVKKTGEFYSNRTRGEIAEAVSTHNRNFYYVVGQTVVPEGDFSYTFDECQSGIHFFFNLNQALNY